MKKQVDRKQTIYRRNYGLDGRLKSIYRIVEFTEDKNKYCAIPFWQMVMIALGLIAIAIILSAALFIEFNSKRPGLYNESCVGRSCKGGLGLKCINQLCQCQSNQYYVIGCTKKKDYMELCNGNLDSCVDGKNMSCLNGYCMCDYSSYWDGKVCLTMKKYGEKCTSDENCNKDLLLTCDKTRMKCYCSSDRYEY